MKKFGRRIGSQGMTFLRAAGIMAIVVAFAFGLAHGTPGHGQSQDAITYPAGYEFDVATIYLSKDNGPNRLLGFLSPDSYRTQNLAMKNVIRQSYDVPNTNEEMVVGGPKWLDTERYYITAKLDASVADKLKKLRPEQRKATQNQMVRALLADRFKLQTHRETKEFPVYAMTIAKSGLKLHEAKPGDTYENATFPYADKFAGGSEKAGQMFLVGGGGPEGQTMTLYAFGVSMSALAAQLTPLAGQIVQDRTGLKGSYDITLKYWYTMRTPSTASDGQVPEPTGGPTFFQAIQQQLGLKLEATKGSVEIVVIDHVERPSGN